MSSVAVTDAGGKEFDEAAAGAFPLGVNGEGSLRMAKQAILLTERQAPRSTLPPESGGIP